MDRVSTSNILEENIVMKISNIETDITDHCNLSCADCSHHSPYITKGFYDINQFERDINTIAHRVQCEWFKILGGEPLLNTNIEQYIDILRSSGICNKIAIFTNGTLLHRVSIDTFKDVDCVVVSRYPGTGKYKNLITTNVERLREHVDVIHNYYDTFEAQNFLTVNDSVELVQQIFDRCKLRYECNAIYKGYFYKCIACQRKGQFLSKHGVNDLKLSDPAVDGISIYADNFTEQFIKYYYSNEPLYACRYCTGSSGRDVAHSNKLTKPSTAVNDVICKDKLKLPPVCESQSISFLQADIISRTTSVSGREFIDNDGLSHDI